ncbi:sensor histidine kinase [Cryobacterium psychrophilum]|uniref:histidine kinase n=1 Tax=Cryobacterium psychrophilum TaxID=41988 RepID=A0A4Y8KRD7_9MICO|nr:histidine kinase [Cryobacterium psychrophilum]TDW29967.1 signal transduction histidine kinase [Cryobacterium psychrophilum]TFD76525.1 two-component sensor histidine kinase [Cryobacterium psychrophilum]
MTATPLSPGRNTLPGGDLNLPTPPGLIRRFWARHPRVADLLLASMYFVPMAIALIVDALLGAGAPQGMLILNAVVVVAVSGALLFRRRAPRLVLVITALGMVAGFAEYGQGHLLPVLLALYAVAVYRDVSTAWVGFGASALLGALSVWLNEGVTFMSWVAVASQVVIMMLAATLIGVNVGNGKRYVAALVDLAAQLAAERDQQAQLARVSERARIAREMHDVVAHSLSVMVALADGANAIAPKDPERSREAMLEVASTGRSSMREMRRLLGVLAEAPETGAAVRQGGRDRREPAAVRAPLEPQPGTEQLVELVESFRAAKLPIRLEQNGRGPNNAGVQLTIYRIVQESLTNVLRYSESPTLVTVRIVATSGGVEVIVADNGLGHSPAPSQGSGRGIIGLQERVALYGGTLEAGPAANRGWRVTATMVFDPEEKA